jgi:hypothetical protein
VSNNPVEARIWQLVEQAAKDVSDDDGRFDDVKLREKLRDLLTIDDLNPVEKQATIDMLVKTLTTTFIRRRNPKRQPSGTLFNAASVIPLGDGKRVWMEQATDDDLLAWASLSTANLSRVAIAEGNRQRYVSERLAELRKHPDWRLGRVEREIFGYVEYEADESEWDPDDDM